MGVSPSGFFFVDFRFCRDSFDFEERVDFRELLFGDEEAALDRGEDDALSLVLVVLLSSPFDV